MEQTNETRDQNGNNNNNHHNHNGHISWSPNNIWELNCNSSRLELDWATANSVYGTTAVDSLVASSGGTTRSDINVISGGQGQAFWLQTHDGDGVVPGHQQHQFLYGGDHGTHFHPDPHLMCLKLGKRHYFEDATVVGGVGGFSAVGKRGKGLYGGGEGMYGQVPTTVPRCQVEGCHVALVNAKDYHRRHRVCEMHSKAPRVVVLGLEQRFCQQCSRFHVVSEFDDSKRSCRRRLAGHNERRRKSSHDSVAARTSSQDNRSMSGRFPYLSPASPTGCALSLLSSKNDYWAMATTTPSDLSLRSSAALRELIAENRATILARQLCSDREWHSNQHQQVSTDDFSDVVPPFHHHHHHPMYSDQQSSGWVRIHESDSAHVTLDLMQAPSTAFGFLSMRGKSKEEDEDIWNSFHDSHVV